jgi:hypothetical protein
MVSIPTSYIWKGGERVRVNTQDAAEWVDRGWSLTDPATVQPAPAAAPVVPVEKPAVKRGKSKSG